jgi:hypothetical protein
MFTAVVRLQVISALHPLINRFMNYDKKLTQPALGWRMLNQNEKSALLGAKA